MEWKNNLIKHLPWSDSIVNRTGKEIVARELAEKVREGDTLGVGSGSTVYLTLFAIAQKIRDKNIHIRVIPASSEISMTCTQLGIPQTTLLEARPDWTFDGADEVDPRGNLLKGRGGASFKEKLLISSSPQTYILVDESKLVKCLGEGFPVPVEIFPGALTLVNEKLRSMGMTESVLRLAKGKDGPVYTENGNWILDVRFPQLDSSYEKKIKSIPGVIESGLFCGYPVTLMVAKLG